MIAPQSGYLRIVDSRGRPIPVMTAADYEGATTGRRLGTWGTSTTGPSTVIFNNLSSLRSRSRQIIRNNPLIDGGVDTLVSNIIGSGINPRWKLDDKDLKANIQELWNDWVDEADFYNVQNFYGLQGLVCRGLIDAGESLVRVIPRRRDDALSVPVQLQVLEADHLDETFNSVEPSTGNEIRMGIEIDREGRRVAYHLYTEHPGEAFLTARSLGDRIRVPAAQIMHVFKPLRAGQMRGRPFLASIILKLRELDQYTDAELVRKKTAAMFGGFITETSALQGDPTAFFGVRSASDSEARTVLALEPGTFPVLPRGMSVEFSQPVDVGQTFDVWIKQTLREIAAGMNITYEQLTGDLTGVNYSSIRAGLLEFRRRVMQLQHFVLIFQFCRPVARVWMDAAILSGALEIADYMPNRRRYLRVKWIPDGWAWVDPQKDQTAAKEAVRSGFSSRAKIVAERGDDVEAIDAENAEDNARADELGLVYDTDPRKTGKTALTPPPRDDAEEGDGDDPAGRSKGEQP